MTQEGMQGVAKAYFDKLFTSSNKDYGLVLECVNPRLSEDSNHEITRPFLIDEFREALFNMNSDKASCPDKFNPTFYKRFWSTSGEDLFQTYVSWL